MPTLARFYGIVIKMYFFDPSIIRLISMPYMEKMRRFLPFALVK